MYSVLVPALLLVAVTMLLLKYRLPETHARFLGNGWQPVRYVVNLLFFAASMDPMRCAGQCQRHVVVGARGFQRARRPHRPVPSGTLLPRRPMCNPP